MKASVKHGQDLNESLHVYLSCHREPGPLVSSRQNQLQRKTTHPKHTCNYELSPLHPPLALLNLTPTPSLGLIVRLNAFLGGPSLPHHSTASNVCNILTTT